MTRQIFLVLSVWMAGLSATTMRRIAQIPSGPYHDGHGRVVCCDSDHDSLPEMYFFYNPDACHQTWESQGWNRFGLVFEDTACQHPSVRVRTAVPYDAGDIDDDGLTDIVCVTVEPVSSILTFYDDVITIESPDSLSYPCSLSWYCRCGNNFAIPFATFYPPDLDNDGHKEIISATPSLGLCIWENTGNNQNALVWRDTVHAFSCMTFGDFDLDGKMNFASASAGSYGITSVWECTGDNQYQLVYQDTVRQPNGADAFTTNDIDGDGKPEFYVAFENVPRGKIDLYMWEVDQAGTDVYHRTLVDSVSFSGDDWGRISECGDIDADGVEECIWTTPAEINVYKAIGDNNLQKVWNWYSDHGSMKSLVSTVYDINNDGYNELITAGNGKTSIFEVDAVDLVSPNGGNFRPGDTVSIRWVTHTPPRCDSLSLLLRRDSSWFLDTIARGLPASDTFYRWVVPATVPDTGRVVVIAYGPGWQFDIADSVINFTGGGVAEGTRNMPSQWSLSVSQNPARGAFTVRYDVPGKWGQSQPLLGQTEVQSPFSTDPVFALGIYDAGGRLVRSLSEGDVPPGRYEVKLPAGILPAGVYFCTLANGAARISRKIVLTE